MAVYCFRYADQFGAALRTTVMQCTADADAIAKARDIMPEPYARLEIYEEDRAVYSQMADRGSYLL